MILAAIDIGSNAGRLLVASVKRGSESVVVNRIAFVRVPLRLGMDVFSKGRISQERTAYLIKTLQAFKELLDLYSPTAIKACATAAMRESENGAEIADLVERIVGFPIHIIDGLEEARIIRNSGDFPPPTETSHSLLVDLGGGSMEMTILKQGNFVCSASFKIGTVRMLNNRIPDGEWERVEDWLVENVSGKDCVRIIGSGGNINKLTKMYGDVFTNTINEEQLELGLENLNTFSVEERMDQLGLKEDRADVIVPAAAVFLRIMKATGVNQVLAPKIGLVDGLLHELFDEYNPTNDI